jgi:hypothetical protein
MNAWDMWKKGFDAWENETAKFLENVIKSPLVLGPSGAMLTGLMKAKTASDKARNLLLGAVGLPTRADQERVLHALNKLESRLMDLEEKLDDRAEREQPKKTLNGAGSHTHAAHEASN